MLVGRGNAAPGDTIVQLGPLMEALFEGPRTTPSAGLRCIYLKLGVNSRVELTRVSALHNADTPAKK
jgi:hypothetical protein